jgi:hypothetical protein
MYIYIYLIVVFMLPAFLFNLLCALDFKSEYKLFEFSLNSICNIKSVEKEKVLNP